MEGKETKITITNDNLEPRKFKISIEFLCILKIRIIESILYVFKLSTNACLVRRTYYVDEILQSMS